jgi:hypothetical protein
MMMRGAKLVTSVQVLLVIDVRLPAAFVLFDVQANTVAVAIAVDIERVSMGASSVRVDRASMVVAVVPAEMA